MISLSYQHLKRRDGVLGRKTSKDKEAKETAKKRSGPSRKTSSGTSAARSTETVPATGTESTDKIGQVEPIDATKKTFRDDAALVDKIVRLKNGADDKTRPRSAGSAAAAAKICDGSSISELRLKPPTH